MSSRFIIILFFYLTLSKIKAEAISSENIQYFSLVAYSNTLVAGTEAPPATLSDKYVEHYVDMTLEPNFLGSVDNTRFTKVSDLEGIVNIILNFKSTNPTAHIKKRKYSYLFSNDVL